jgi:hypothetical protein
VAEEGEEAAETEVTEQEAETVEGESEDTVEE